MKRYVIAGTGSRGISAYLIPLTTQYTDCVQICGLYDINPKRAALGARKAGYEIPVFEDFDRMLKETNPDAVIVTTKDCTHDTYIIKALEFGCDVVSEKPITTDEKKFKAIYEAEQRTGKKVTITFNCRFMPNFVRVKKLIMNGEIGEVLNAHYQWFLDRSHGADYFRRWHREIKNSGSLLVHKSTHHFDLLNWFLDDEPEKVNAFGTKRFYGPTREQRGERCLTCDYKKSCEFLYDLTAPEKAWERELYLECEDVDGYYRDSCLFSDVIDIPDSVSANIRYKKGTVASYSLVTYAPYEGVRLTLNGTKGRLELAINSSGEDIGCTITIFDANGEKRIYQPPRKESRGHGSGDINYFDAIFRGCVDDKLGQVANSRAGAMSIGIGIAALKSIQEDRAVTIKELFEYL